jgi:hypothetical protein
MVFFPLAQASLGFVYGDYGSRAEQVNSVYYPPGIVFSEPMPLVGALRKKRNQG